MVTAGTSTPEQRPSQNTKRRPPPLPSDVDTVPPRRPKSREVTSRYLSLSTSSTSSNSSSSTNTTSSSINSGSSIPSTRSRSPMIGTRATITTPKSLPRAASAERRRPTPSCAEKMLVTSIRSLSVSFQGESYSVPVSKVKPPPTVVVTPRVLRKASPERRKAGVTPARDRKEKDRENSRPSEQQQQHRWPGRLRAENSSLFTRSLDYGADRAKFNGSGSILKDLRKSMVAEISINKVGNESKLKNDNEKIREISELEISNEVESVSSESIGNGVQERAVPAPGRCWQEPASPLLNGASNRKLGPSKLASAKKFQNNNSVSSPRELCSTRGLSPVRGGARAASPCKALTSSTGALLRGIESPSIARSRTGNLVNDNITLSYAVDVRRGKLGDNRIAYAHDLKLLYNRLLQWRFVNAKIENTMLVQRRTSERSLYNACVTSSKLRQSITSKGIELQLLRHSLKLYSMLKKQEPHLESWDLLERNHCNSVSGAIKALEASIICLPAVSGARADVIKLQEAITSAVDMMEAMSSSVCSLLMKVEQMNLLVSELSKTSAQEHRLMDECKDLFSNTFLPLQVSDAM
ncbi:hypothetical protein CASFOL_038221 [Castilleja foliolosa]|uniref:Uncharacterized protein n=1 Tax=Castilleja foliolosa TaxID=1961234 RepID=A0ABD3BKF3_9LAMI